MSVDMTKTILNDIGLVDIEIGTADGTIAITQLGPNDVAVECNPGNGGNVFDFQEGSTGQAFFNKSYKVKNWEVRIRLLRNSFNYAQVTYLIEKVLSGSISMCSLLVRNKNFGGINDDAVNEKLYASQAVVQNIAGHEFGSGVSGDFEITFKTTGAEYTSGAFVSADGSISSEPFADRGGNTND